MKQLLDEIEKAHFDLEKLNRWAPHVHELKPGSPIRAVFEQQGRIARTLNRVPSFLDRQDGKAELKTYQSLLKEARGSLG